MKIPSINTERIVQLFNRSGEAFFSSESFQIKANNNGTNNLIRASIITGKKKVSKSAVIRNRVDRRLRVALSTVLPQHKLKGKERKKKKINPVVLISQKT